MSSLQGWDNTSQSPELFSNTIISPSLEGDTTPPVDFKIEVNNSTGVIKLFRKSDNQEFYNFNPETGSWNLPSPSARNIYNEVIVQIGEGNLSPLINNSRKYASDVISKTSDPITIDRLKATTGYKSSLSNINTDASQSNVDLTITVTGTPDTPDTPVDLSPIDLDNKTEQRQYGYYAYPIDMLLSDGDFSSAQDVVEFIQYEYGKRSLDTSTETFGFGDRGFKKVDGSVTLAIPAGIQDNNQVKWTDDELNALQAEAARTSLEAMKDPSAAIQGAIDRLGNAGLNADVQNAIRTALAAKAVGVNNLLSRTSGAILNPNTELLFSGPGLRDFTYSVEMAPKNGDEARNIRDIIRFFKEGMAPRRESLGLFLKAPNVFTIKYLYQRDGSAGFKQINPYINMVKHKCALRNCSVDYTPQGTYMSHSEDGSMVAYRMTLSFTELEPVYYKDYAEIGTNSIGY